MSESLRGRLTRRAREALLVSFSAETAQSAGESGIAPTLTPWLTLFRSSVDDIGEINVISLRANSITTDRQRRLFGQSFNDNLSSLRVCVVGCGGTGSPVSLLLARRGWAHIPRR